MAYYKYGADDGFNKTYLYVTTDSPNYSKSQYKVTFYYGIIATSRHTHVPSHDTVTVSATGYSSQTFVPSHASGTLDPGEWFNYGSKTVYFPKKENKYTATVSVKIVSRWNVTTTSTATATFTVPALEQYSIKFDAHKPSGASGSVTNMPISSLAKYYGKPLTLWANRPKLTNYTFTGWYSAGKMYQPSGTLTAEGNRTLYAQWSYDNPPTIKTLPQNVTLANANNGGKAVKNFSGATVQIKGAKPYTGRTITSIKLTIGSQSATISGSALSPSGDGTISIPKLTVAGTFTPTITITDSASKSMTYSLKALTVMNPTWQKTIDVDAAPPAIDSSGKPILTKFEVYNYNSSPPAYETATVNFKASVDGANAWSFNYVFGEKYVSNPLITTPNVSVRLTYVHYDTIEKEYRKAFFSTSRNCSFSNGIYNTMFVSGADPTQYPNFTSRVWWCAVNDPLYFPDLNYIEVGSNDTAVKGLAKVGSYLGAIKQSKTTDTAIYLIYPTSFDEETTYAVKQGVQGIGALAKYTFNILGDETLFLSPNGVMAIVEGADEQHKVQNRSYYVDKKLLAEDSLEDAYSFVYDGKYWLSVVGDEAHCYVLDGNQRNSWGNDRTVLVYECYYLDNIPARCFVKYDNDLIFSTGNEICRMKKKTDADPFIDDFRYGNEKAYNKTVVAWYNPVDITQAEFEADKTHYWVMVGDEYVQCTEDDVWDADETYYEYINIYNDDPTQFYVLNEDGDFVQCQPYIIAVITEDEFDEDPTQYYTFANNTYTQCQVGDTFDPDETYYVQTAYDEDETYYTLVRVTVPVQAEWSTVFDDDGSLHYYKTMQKKGNIVSVLPLDDVIEYDEVTITEEEFNENKKKYFLLIDDEYVQCKADDEFDESATYYIEHRSSTKVFVKKDGNDEVEIQRTFSRSSKVPSEMVLRKKFKKYKRLQFILRNDEAEDFGVDQIVKSYMLKSYTKK